MRKKLMVFNLFILCVLSSMASDYNVKDYGAVSDGNTVCTEAIQQTIDECNSNGGGTVYIQGGGEYISGTLYLKSNVTLHIGNGTVLKGSSNIKDYTTDTHKNMYKREPHMDRCFIFCKDAHSVAIEGQGTIDGNGTTLHKQRPMMLRFINSSNIRVNDVTLKDPCAWTSAWLYCNDISVKGVKITSLVNRNGDGLDFDGCIGVRVTNCLFENSDDCICLQASRPDKPCMDVTVSNCIFSTKWGGMRIGLLSRGDIKYVTVSNCVFKNISDSGLKIQQCEGGEMGYMTFSNLVMHNVPRPIFMTFCQQRACVDSPEGQYEPLKRMHDFKFSNIIIDDSNCEAGKDCAIYLTGFPDYRIENIDINNVNFIVPGGGTKEDSKKTIKEYTLDLLKHHWPEFSLTKTLPAYGVYARHIDGLNLTNISVTTLSKDARKVIKTVDVKNYKKDKIVEKNK